MTITSLRIQNFKSFGSMRELELAPITLVFGPNSSGKSSLIQSLLLIRQSIQGHSDRFPGLIAKGDLIDLGSFRTLIHNHDRNSLLKIGVTFTPDHVLPSPPQRVTRRRGLMSNLEPDTELRVDLGFKRGSGGRGSHDSGHLRNVELGVSGKHPFGLTLNRTRAARDDESRNRLSNLGSRRFIWSPRNLDNLLRLSGYDKRRDFSLINYDRRISELEKELQQSQQFVDTSKEAVDALERIVKNSNLLEDKESTADLGKLLVYLKTSSEQDSTRIKQRLSRTLEEVRRLRNSLAHDGPDSSESLSDQTYIRGIGFLPTVVVPRNRSHRQVTRQVQYALSDALAEMAASFESQFQALVYLGPLRSAPSRYYVPTGSERLDVGSTGEYAPEVLLHRTEDLEKTISNWFERFEIPYSFKAGTTGDELTGEIITLRLRDRRSGIDVAPSDVGFGIGQMFPIVVQGILSSESGGATIAVEQPEIHLHPRLQAHIADLMIETSSATSPSGQSFGSNQWIAETHSETLMLRIQRRIREGLLRPGDVSVLYVQLNEQGESELYSLKLDDSGEFIDEWPSGFFEDSFDEMFS